jgi:hypothetical protein
MKQQMSRKEVWKHAKDVGTQCAESLMKIVDMEAAGGMPPDGVTCVVGEVGFSGKKYDITFCVTEKGIVDDFRISQFKKGKAPTNN